MLLNKLTGFSKDAIVYGAGDALGRLVGFVLLPILSRVFVPADYGIIDLMTVSYMLTLVGLRLDVHSGLQRFYYKFEVRQRQVAVTSSAFFLVASNAAVALGLWPLAGTISSLLAGDPERIRVAVILLASCLPIEAMWDSLVLLLRLNRRAVLFSMANVLRVTITPVLTYAFVVVWDAGVAGVFGAKLISLFLITGFLFIAQRHEFTPRISLSAYGSIIRFSLPGYPGLLIREGMNVLPRYLLAYFAPLTAVGLFGIAFRISNVARLAIGAFNRAWNPFAYSHEGTKEERRIYEIVFKSFYGGIFVIAFGLSLFARELVALLTPEQYLAAFRLVPGVVAYLAMEGLTLIFSTALYTRGQVHWASYLNALRLAVFLGLGLLLIPRHGAAGLVIAMDAGALVYLLFFGWIVRRSFEFSIPIAKMTVTAIVGVGLVLAFNLSSMTGWWLLTTKSLCLLVVIGFTGLFLLTRHERERLTEVVVRRRHGPGA